LREYLGDGFFLLLPLPAPRKQMVTLIMLY